MKLTASEIATYHLVADAIMLALEAPDVLSPRDARGLRALLKPRRVRTAVRDVCGRRWAVAVAVAELALEHGARVVPDLASALDLNRSEAAELLRKYKGGARSAALALVAESEGVTHRTVRDRTRGPRYRWDVGFALRVTCRRLSLPLPASAKGLPRGKA